MKSSFIFAPLAIAAALAVGGCSMQNPGMLCDGIFASQIEACRGHDVFYQYKPGESNFYAAKAKCSQHAQGIRQNILAQGEAQAARIRQQEIERQQRSQQHAQTQAIIGALGEKSGTYFPPPDYSDINPGGYAAGQAQLNAGLNAAAAAQSAMLSCLAELGWLRCTQGGQGRPDCPN